MSAEVMGSHLNTHHYARFNDDRPSCRICDWKDPFVRVDALIPDIIIETIGQLLGDKDDLSFPAAFRLSEIQLAILNISGS
jgi:hypothetical protein